MFGCSLQQYQLIWQLEVEEEEEGEEIHVLQNHVIWP